MPPTTRRLSVGALGVALVVVVGAAFGSGLLYLAARLGVGSPVRLAIVDAVHITTGTIGGVFLIAKIVRIGRPGAGGLVTRALLLLYGAIFATGVLALLPAPGRVGTYLVQAHLMASAWAVLPTGWHVWRHRRRALAYLARARPALPSAGAAAIALLTVAAMAPRPVSAVSRVDADGAWTIAGVPGVPMQRLAMPPDSSRLYAAGGTTLCTTADGRTWHRNTLPAPPSDSAPGFVPATGHGHVVTGTTVQALVATAHAVYIATTQGLYAARGAGPATRLDLPGRALDDLPLGVGWPGTDVRAVAVRPDRESELWTAGSAGALRSTDAGRTWTRVVDGLADPTGMAAVAYLGPRLFGSDTSAVYDLHHGRWRRVRELPGVVELSATADGLLAVTGTGAAAQFSAGTWSSVPAPPRPRTHQTHSTHAQAARVTLAVAAGRLYAAGTADGVSASADGGRSWTGLGGVGSRAPTQVTAFAGGLWAATDAGVFRRPLHQPAPPPTALWWLGLLTVTVLTALAWVFGPARAPRRRPAHEPPERPLRR